MTLPDTLMPSCFAAFGDTQTISPDQTNAAFNRLKSLEGVWQRAGQPEHGHRIEFRLTAGGSVLVEEWTYEGRPHSLTLYHRDGDTLLATHYCPQGNQPRLAMAPDESGVSFTFRDATDLDLETEQFQHDLSLELTENGQLIRSEVYLDGDNEHHPSKLLLERAV